LVSSQPAGTLLKFICVASDANLDTIYHRFFLTGPGTANKKMLVQDWSRKNYWEWNSRTEDIGTSTIEVQIRDGLHAVEGSYDANSTVSYTITAVSTGSAPTITSLTPSLSSPRGQGTAVDFICIAADADLDPIYYRFFLTGPGTASKKMMVQDWSKKNAWHWTPGANDIGSNTIEVQVRDGKHAGEGSYDATSNISFTVSSNTAPTISEVYVNEPGHPFVNDKIHVVATALDTDGDLLLYKFWLYRETVGASWESLTGWQTENWILYQIDKMDFETISIKCQVRDGKHAGEESFDAEAQVTIDVQRAAITTLTPSLATPQAHENTIAFTCLANKTSRIYYRFWLSGPGTGDAWRDMTGWQAKNSWSWRTLACDIGENYVRAEVCDNPETWDDADTTGRRADTYYEII
jgi:large repetitive protein